MLSNTAGAKTWPVNVYDVTNLLLMHRRYCLTVTLNPHISLRLYKQYNTKIQYNTKFVKRHVAVASEALVNRSVKKQRRRRTNVL